MAETSHFDATELFSLKGYVCLITGGGTGIGLMHAQALSANGAKVYITGRRMAALETAADEHQPKNQSGKIIPIGPCDVTKKEDLESLYKDLANKEKFLNLLICNAGVSSEKADIAKEDARDLKKEVWDNETVENWRDTYETNVASVYFTSVAFLPMLQAAIKVGGMEEYGPSIITISSMSGMMRHFQNHANYNSSKAACVHLTKMMSAEFQRTGVRVNSIAPGYFPSEMSANDSDDRQKSSLPAKKVAEKGHVPAMRAGRDTEMGSISLLLARNHYLNGVVIPVDGGVLNVVGS